MAQSEVNTGECKYEVKPVKPEDVRDIDLRELDALELNLTVDGGIRECVQESNEAYVVEIDGMPEAYFGVTRSGVVWYLSSWAPICKFPKDFQRLTDFFLNKWLRQYKRIWNTTLTKNYASIKWLIHKGFTTESMGKWTMFWKEVSP